MLDLLRRIPGEFNREPQGGAVYWVLLCLGLALTIVAVVALGASAVRGEPSIVWVNGVFSFLVIACIGAAEVLPAERRTLTVLLRVCVVVFAVLAVGMFLLRTLGG